MSLDELQVVILERDLPDNGLQKGDVGTVVHVHSPDAVMVEFMTAAGNTVALVDLKTADLRKAKRTDMMTVRHRKSRANDADR